MPLAFPDDLGPRDFLGTTPEAARYRAELPELASPRNEGPLYDIGREEALARAIAWIESKYGAAR